MSRALNVPAEADILCEGCGYVLNGLPSGNRCPECGKPDFESAAALRKPSPWEAATRGELVSAWVRTTSEVVFHPRNFFRSLSVEPGSPESRAFGRSQWIGGSVLFGVAAWAHVDSFGGMDLPGVPARMVRPAYWLSLPALIIFAYLMLFGLNLLAAHLTHFEATYRGMRLPANVVLRVLHYHGAHYLPVGLLGAATALGFNIFLHRSPDLAARRLNQYVYVLSGEVIVSAAYLFKTYWIAMRNTMYANRKVPATHTREKPQ